MLYSVVQTLPGVVMHACMLCCCDSQHVQQKPGCISSGHTSGSQLTQHIPDWVTAAASSHCTKLAQADCVPDHHTGYVGFVLPLKANVLQGKLRGLLWHYSGRVP